MLHKRHWWIIESFMPDTTQQTASGDTAGRNYVLGIINGALGRCGMGFMHPDLVLAAFVYELTGSNLLVGLVTALAAAGIMWPQLYVSSRIEHLARKKPVYVAVSIARASLLLALVASMWLAVRYRSAWSLVLFFVVFVALRSAQGGGNPPFLDIVAQTVRPSRLGGFFAYRTLFGEALALAGGFLVMQPILRSAAGPGSYAALVGIAFLTMSTAWLVFSFCNEPRNPAPPEPRTLRRTVSATGSILRHDRNYRLLLAIRVLVRVNFLALSFFVPFGDERLGVVRISGVFIGCISFSRLVSSLLWGKLSDRWGGRLCLICAGALLTLSPLTAAAAPRMPGLFQWTLPFTAVPLDLRLCLYLGSLLLFGMGAEAYMIGTQAFTLEAAPPHRRPSYIAFLNTLTFPLTFLPLLAGALIGAKAERLDLVFIVAAAGGALVLLASYALREVREAAGAQGDR